MSLYKYFLHKGLYKYKEGRKLPAGFRKPKGKKEKEGDTEDGVETEDGGETGEEVGQGGTSTDGKKKKKKKAALEGYCRADRIELDKLKKYIQGVSKEVLLYRRARQQK